MLSVINSLLLFLHYPFGRCPDAARRRRGIKMKIGGDLQGEPIIFLTLEADADGKGAEACTKGE